MNTADNNRQVIAATNGQPTSAVCQILKRDGDTELSRVRVSWQEGELMLDGFVTSYYRKQMAQTLAKSIPGVEQIRNRIRVAHSPAPADIAD